MYKVWIKRNFREIWSIGEGTYKIVVERLYGIVVAHFRMHKESSEQTRNEWVTVGTVSAGKKIRHRRIFCTGKTSEIRRAESFCLWKLLPTIAQSFIVRFSWFLVRSKAIVCVQMLCIASVRFGHSFIFIGNWVQICTFCLQHEIGELRGYNGFVYPPDQLLHHSKGPDLSCFCTDHVASCCSRRGFCFSLSSQFLLVFFVMYNVDNKELLQIFSQRVAVAAEVCLICKFLT